MAFTVADGRTAITLISKAIVCRIAAAATTAIVGDQNLDTDGDTAIPVSGGQQAGLLAKSNAFVAGAKIVVNGGTIASGQFAGTYPGW